MNIKFPKILSRLFDTDWRYFVAWGSRAGLKSWSIAQALLIRGKAMPLRILCTREIQNSLADSVHHLLRLQIELLKMESFYTITDTEIYGINGTSFIFAGLRTNVEKIKSFENIDICWIEEGANISKRSYDILIPTIRKEGSQIIISFNPELDTDETYQRFVVASPANAVVVKTTWEDNPWFTETLRKEMEACKLRDPVAYDNIWLGNCRMAIEGAVYALELAAANEEGRIGDVRYDPSRPVSTFWDIGWADFTSIWFVQIVGNEFRLIDFYQNQFRKTPDYCETLQKKGYRYDRIHLPHDAENQSGNAERTWKQIVQSSFPNAWVSTGESFRGSVKHGIEAARNIFPLCLFDREKCADGLQALRHYRWAVDPVTGKSGKEPEHDYASHASDAFREMAMAISEEPQFIIEKPVLAHRPRLG